VLAVICTFSAAYALFAIYYRIPRYLASWNAMEYFL
jgi:hypothetical protein